MSARTLDDVLPVMQDMVALELALAELYGACSERFPQDRDLWARIRGQEEGHARSIRRLVELITAHPGEFRPGRSFNSAAVRTVMKSVAQYADEVRGGRLPARRALNVAKDLENSLLEASYASVVATENREFQQTMAAIVEETVGHRELLAAAARRAAP